MCLSQESRGQKMSDIKPVGWQVRVVTEAMMDSVVVDGEHLTRCHEQLHVMRHLLPVPDVDVTRTSAR